MSDEKNFQGMNFQTLFLTSILLSNLVMTFIKYLHKISYT